MKMKNLIAQFIPIILIFILVTYSKPLALFSNTALGKLLAIGIIIFYTYLDKYVGLFICALVILYYQSDYVENMLNMDGAMDMEAVGDTLLAQHTDIDMNDTIDDYVYLSNDDVKPQLSKQTKKGAKVEPFTEYNKASHGDVQDQFREQNCKNGTLYYKNMRVRPEMAGHVFPELNFAKNYPCNPCDKSCDISITEAKLETEAKLVPISSSDAPTI